MSQFDLIQELAGIDGARDLQMQGPLNDRPTNIASPGEFDDYNPLVDTPDKHKEQLKDVTDEANNALNKLLVFIQTQDSTQPQFGQLEQAIDGVLTLIDGLSQDPAPTSAPIVGSNSPGDTGAGGVGSF